MGFVLVLAIISEIIGSLVGFGSSTIFLPMALWFWDFRTALVMTAWLHIFGNLARLNFFGKSLSRQLVWKFGLPSIAASAVGALTVEMLPVDQLKALLGLFLVGYALMVLAKKQLRMQPTPVNLVMGGVTSGFAAGLIGTGGALRGAFLSALGLAKEKYIATAAITALLVDMTRIPVYLKSGFLAPEMWIWVILLLPCAWLGTVIGKRLLKHIPQEGFEKIVITGIGIIGIKLFMDWAFGGA